jgi:Uncharacterized protein conserved in bacteria
MAPPLGSFFFCSLGWDTEKIKGWILMFDETIGIFVGPAGDFTAPGYESFKLGVHSIGVSLGPDVFHSATAAITATSIIMEPIYYA